MQLPEIQAVDLAAYTRGDAAARAAECAKAAASLHATGCLYVKDARVAAVDNERFLDLLERYFAASDGKRDARPELHYQVGVTPAMVERPRDHCARVAAFDLPDKPLTLCPPEADPKWRYFWRVVRACTWEGIIVVLVHHRHHAMPCVFQPHHAIPQPHRARAPPAPASRSSTTRRSSRPTSPTSGRR